MHLKNENIQPRSGRQGRYGRDGYAGAEKIDVKHPDLSPRQKCPGCKKGRLTEVEAAVDYAWQGQAPLKLDIYLLQRLLCEGTSAREKAKKTQLCHTERPAHIRWLAGCCWPTNSSQAASRYYSLHDSNTARQLQHSIV